MWNVKFKKILSGSLNNIVDTTEEKITELKNTSEYITQKEAERDYFSFSFFWKSEQLYEAWRTDWELPRYI